MIWYFCMRKFQIQISWMNKCDLWSEEFNISRMSRVSAWIYMEIVRWIPCPRDWGPTRKRRPKPKEEQPGRLTLRKKTQIQDRQQSTSSSRGNQSPLTRCTKFRSFLFFSPFSNAKLHSSTWYLSVVKWNVEEQLTLSLPVRRSAVRFHGSNPRQSTYNLDYPRPTTASVDMHANNTTIIIVKVIYLFFYTWILQF